MATMIQLICALGNEDVFFVTRLYPLFFVARRRLLTILSSNYPFNQAPAWRTKRFSYPKSHSHVCHPFVTRFSSSHTSEPL